MRSASEYEPPGFDGNYSENPEGRARLFAALVEAILQWKAYHRIVEEHPESGG
jgi:hypothetical protein